MHIAHVDLSTDLLVVAEIGNNHEGSVTRAKELIYSAAECGVNAVKLQTFKAEHLVSRKDHARFSRLQSFELTIEQFEELATLAKSLNLAFLSTSFDLESVASLEPFIDGYKIASGDNNFFPLIRRIIETGKPFIISTGATDLSHVKQTVDFVRDHAGDDGVRNRMGLLHCVSCYPVSDRDANLRVISLFRDSFECTIGYSDHTIGPDALVLSVALGAKIVEKHFTLDKQLSDFRDHHLSADPQDMKDIVQRISVATTLLGEPSKVVLPCEANTEREFRRSIVAGRDLQKGHRIVWSDLSWIRLQGGLSPGEEETLIGQELNRDVASGEPFVLADIR